MKKKTYCYENRTIDTENYNNQYIELETYYCENCNKSFLREVYWKMVYGSEQWKEA